MLTDHDKQAMGNREPANEMNNPTQGSPVWLQPFTVDLENSDSERDASKVEKKNGSTVFMLTSAKIKRDLFCEKKSMET